MRLVQAAGGQCRAYTVDLCDRQAVYAAATKLKQEVGHVSMACLRAMTGANTVTAATACTLC